MENQILFSSIIEDKELLNALNKMNFKTPTEVQAKSIGPMMSGNDITVQAPTGTGKTAAFGIPLLQKVDPKNRNVQALILCPTRELALQISDVLKKIAVFKPGIKITTIYGGERIEKQFSLLRRKPQIVVATPGRLIDHMQRNTIKLDNLQVLVLDEADRMLDMGFRPDLDKILKLVPKERQTALFSATISADIKAIADNYQQNSQMIEIEQLALTVESVEQYYKIVARNEKTNELIETFIEKHPVRTIVFTNTKKMAETVVFKLKQEGYKAAYLHGDLKQGQRNRIMSQYKNGSLDILVATDVAARGIDVDNIDMVVNYDLPKDFDSYVHRIGRTGRANNTGVAYTLIYRGEYEEIISLMKATKAVIAPIVASTGEVRPYLGKPQPKSNERRRPQSGERGERSSRDGKKRDYSGKKNEKPKRSRFSGDRKNYKPKQGN